MMDPKLKYTDVTHSVRVCEKSIKQLILKASLVYNMVSAIANKRPSEKQMESDAKKTLASVRVLRDNESNKHEAFALVFFNGCVRDEVFVELEDHYIEYVDKKTDNNKDK